MSHPEGASSRTKSHETNKITKAHTPNERCKELANEPKGPSTEASEEGELLKRPGVLSKAVAEAKVPRFRSPPASHLPHRPHPRTLAFTLIFTLAFTLAFTLRAPGGPLPTLLRLR